MTTTTNYDYECDYLVVGGGATGMAFCDTLLHHSPTTANPRVIVVDAHATPGGQWHDSYNFVRLHQPSKGYGVESSELAPNSEDDHRATRSEILDYYQTVATDLASNHDFEFLGNTTLDRAQLLDRNSTRQDYTVTNHTTGTVQTVRVRKRLVDARNLEPDLPVSTRPKFSYSEDAIDVLPVNAIANDNTNDNNSSVAANDKKHFVVVGGGKTGMDAVYHLLTQQHISPDNLLWVVPNDAWITAREQIGNCIELLHKAAKLHTELPTADDEKKEADTAMTPTMQAIGPDFFQKGFLEWEQEGHVYRLDPSVVPTKFKDATLSRAELAVLQTVSRVRKGRISEITDDGTLVFGDGSTLELPFQVSDTLFVHCAAGAFHCSKSVAEPPPIFEAHKIVVQDVYGTPGFCFVGSIIAKLESLAGLSDDDRNAMARCPKPAAAAPKPNPLGKSDGDVLGAITHQHPYIQRARNLRDWMALGPDVQDWLFANRLFHFQGADPTTVRDKLEFVFGVLRDNGIE